MSEADSYATMPDRRSALRSLGLLQHVLVAATLVWLGLAIASLFLITLGTDEAWNLNGLRSLLRPFVPGLSSPVIATSGGLFAAANLAIEWAVGSHVWVHRLFSLICGIATLLVVARFVSGQWFSVVALLSVTPLIGLPGSTGVWTTALGAAPALLLLTGGFITWSRESRSQLSAVIWTGILLGLAAASRFELILVAPAFILANIGDEWVQSRRLRMPAAGELAVVAIMIGIFAINSSVIADPAREGLTNSSTGTDSLLRFLDYPRTLNKMLIARSIMPLFVLVSLSFVALVYFFADTADRSRHKLLSLKLTAGWILYAAWLLQSPIPHLRYLWPALMCFAVCACMILREFYMLAVRQSDVRRQCAVWVVGLSLVANSIACGFRSVVMGEQDYISWEWSREMPVDYFRRFQHIQDQNATASYLRQLPEEAAVVCCIQPYSLRYLTERPVVLIGDFLSTEVKERQSEFFLVLCAGIGMYSHLSPAGIRWIESHCTLERQFGRYSIYRAPVADAVEAAGRLQPRTRQYTGHPLSEPWFGRASPESQREPFLVN